MQSIDVKHHFDVQKLLAENKDRQTYTMNRLFYLDHYSGQ